MKTWLQLNSKCNQLQPNVENVVCKLLKNGGQGRNRTADASLFRAALYQLSYLAGEVLVYQRLHASCNAASAAPVLVSMSACRLWPCASIVTIAAKPFTRMCHIASGMPNSIRCTPRTCSTVRA